MQNKGEVYFLTVSDAKRLAAKHEAEENWDLWTDDEAELLGGMNRMWLNDDLEITNRSAS